MRKVSIYFDMDGTIADLYGVENWLPKLRNFDPSPYAECKPLINLALLARYIHRLQSCGYCIGVITWGSKESNEVYDREVERAKQEWLAKHLPSVCFDDFAYLPYGFEKSELANNSTADILFDDNQSIRESWGGQAFAETEIFEVLQRLLDEEKR